MEANMRRLIFVFLAVALALPSGSAWAVPAPGGSSDYEAPPGSEPFSPPRDVRLVRYGLAGLSTRSIVSGDVVIWDVNSADGLTIALAEEAVTGDRRFAGVAVTAIATDDNGAREFTVGGNWGYIATHGYALASIDSAITVAATSAGAQRVGLYVSAVEGAFTTTEGAPNSQDVAVLLQTSTAGALAPVWIK